MRDFYVRRRAVCLARGRKERRLLRFNRCSPLTFRSPMFFSSLCLFSVSLFSSLCRPSLMLFSLYLSFSFRSTLYSSSSVSVLFAPFTPATLCALFFSFFLGFSHSLSHFISISFPCLISCAVYTLISIPSTPLALFLAAAAAIPENARPLARSLRSLPRSAETFTAAKRLFFESIRLGQRIRDDARKVFRNM